MLTVLVSVWLPLLLSLVVYSSPGQTSTALVKLMALCFFSQFTCELYVMVYARNYHFNSKMWMRALNKKYTRLYAYVRSHNLCATVARIKFFLYTFDDNKLFFRGVCF